MSVKSVNNKRVSRIVGITVIILLYAVAFIIAGKLFSNEFGLFFNWWWSLFGLGIVFLPTSLLIFRDFRDGGFLFSKVIGIAFCGWLCWYLSSIKLIPFTDTGVFVVFLICVILNIAVIFIFRKKKDVFVSERYTIGERIIHALLAELLFLCVFIVWTYIKGFKPESYGTTEKIMDYAFMLSFDKSPYMPATDMWLSGENFNYYYVGQFISTFLSKLSGTGVGYGYNFMLMSEAAFAFVLPFSLVMAVVRDRIEEVKDRLTFGARIIPYFAGLVSAVAVDLCGNGHYVIAGRLVPILQDLLGIKEAVKSAGGTVASYWFPDSTRYIGYFPVTDDKTIHEFPSYSFVLGDLHAHVINICFVLTVVAVLYAYMRYRKQAMSQARENLAYVVRSEENHALFGIPHFFKELFNPSVIAVGFFIGLFHTTNYWDYPIYFVVAGAVLLFTNCIVYNFSWLTLKLTFFHAVIVLVISGIVCLPFTISFNQISTKLCLADNHTPLYQYLILWGLPLVATIAFIAILVSEKKGTGLFNTDECEAIGRKNRLFRFIGGINCGDLFILILALCALGLTLLPEVIYVRDIYSGDFKRANTMFKLTYQAFILFGLSMGYIVTRLIFFTKKKGTRVFGLIILLVLLQTSGYVVNAVDAWFSPSQKDYVGLDSSLYMQKVDEDDWNTICYINDNIDGRPVILETNGASYSDYGRISAWTGCPTLLGWRTHEWLWRSTGTDDMPVIIPDREEAIRTIYTSKDSAAVTKLISQYDISYIYIGDLEIQDYGDDLNRELLTSLGDTVFSSGSSVLIKLRG